MVDVDSELAIELSRCSKETIFRIKKRNLFIIKQVEENVSKMALKDIVTLKENANLNNITIIPCIHRPT